MKFIDVYHCIAYKNVKNIVEFKRDTGCHAAFFYIMTTELLNNILDDIYCFKNDVLKIEVLDELSKEISTTQECLIDFAIHLYNGHEMQKTISTVFASLDKIYFEVALEAIRIRFNKEECSWAIKNFDKKRINN